MCNPEHENMCIVRPKAAETSFLIGHFMAARKNKFGGKRYFVLNPQTCVLQYNEYSTLHNGMPWNFGDTEVKLKTSHGAKTMHLKKASFKDDSRTNNCIVFTPEGDTEQQKKEFNDGNKFYVTERETKMQGKHHYPHIGTSRQLYPSTEALRDILHCHEYFLSPVEYDISVPDEFKAKILQLKKEELQKNKNKKTAKSRAEKLDKYPNFKKLMCLLDLPTDKDDEDIGGPILSYDWYKDWNIPNKEKLSKVPNQAKKNFIFLWKQVAGLTSRFDFVNLQRADFCRSQNEFNQEARKIITKGFFEANKPLDTRLSGFLSVFVRGAYRNMWMQKFDPDRVLTGDRTVKIEEENQDQKGVEVHNDHQADKMKAQQKTLSEDEKKKLEDENKKLEDEKKLKRKPDEIKTVRHIKDQTMLFRGYLHDEAFVEDLTAKVEKKGAFSFEYLAGFSDEIDTIERFLLDEDQNKASNEP